MSKFRKKGGKGLQKINTSSLPDIVFMLLFFFMVATTMRETEIQVRVKVPEATEVKKLEKKSLVSYIYIGRPVAHVARMYGTEPLIQLNDKLVSEEGIPYVKQSLRRAKALIINYSAKKEYRNQGRQR